MYAIQTTLLQTTLLQTTQLILTMFDKLFDKLCSSSADPVDNEFHCCFIVKINVLS